MCGKIDTRVHNSTVMLPGSDAWSGDTNSPKWSLIRITLTVTYALWLAGWQSLAANPKGVSKGSLSQQFLSAQRSLTALSGSPQTGLKATPKGLRAVPKSPKALPSGSRPLPRSPKAFTFSPTTQTGSFRAVDDASPRSADQALQQASEAVHMLQKRYSPCHSIDQPHTLAPAAMPASQTSTRPSAAVKLADPGAPTNSPVNQKAAADSPVTHETSAGSSAIHQAADARPTTNTGRFADSPMQHRAAADSPATFSAAADSPTVQAGMLAGMPISAVPAVPAASPVSTGRSDLELTSPLSDAASGPVMWYNGAVSDADQSDASQATTSHAVCPDSSPAAVAGDHPLPHQHGPVAVRCESFSSFH